ncbi:sigma-70 family RNA polymerase sigma factor [candidate division KSB1 bacterium]|nr:sigma-70 family RNA polymerase sigma factor [candidate division KSB1 bacterium]
MKSLKPRSDKATNSWADETELINKAKNGDKAAMSRIVRDNERLIYNTALKLLANPDDAECVLQETFLKVFQALPTFQGKSSLSTWIYRIATNYALMKLRARRKQGNDLEEAEKQVGRMALESFTRTVGQNPHRMVENSELRLAMENAIDKLPDKFRSVFILKDIEGYSLKEIADMLGMTLAAVKSNLHRARLSLRDQLAEYTESESLTF